MKIEEGEAAAAQPKDDSNEDHSLRNGDSSDVPNGRVSPGGTVYRGRGVRRYQGRYMNLPMRRFHQNGVNLCNNDEVHNGFSHNSLNEEYDPRVNDQHQYNDRRGRSQSPRRWNGNDRRRSPSLERHDGNAYEGKRSRSRSRSPPRRERRNRFRLSRSRSRSENRYKSRRSRGDRYSRSEDAGRGYRSESPRHRRK